jgi:hypothetical protein
MVYDNKAVFGVENQVSYINNEKLWETHQQRAQDYEKVLGLKLGFDATSPRFNYNQVFYAHNLKREVPGPGLY